MRARATWLPRFFRERIDFVNSVTLGLFHCYHEWHVIQPQPSLAIRWPDRVALRHFRQFGGKAHVMAVLVHGGGRGLHFLRGLVLATNRRSSVIAAHEASPELLPDASDGKSLERGGGP